MAVRQVKLGRHDHRKFGEALCDPTVQDAVLAYALQLGGTFTLTDIWRPLGLPRTAVNRVLHRLHNRGFVTRHKIPMAHAQFKMRRACIRQQYLYSLVEPDA